MSEVVWDSVKQPCTVLLRTNPLTAPIWSYTTTSNSVSISNLSYAVTKYYISATNSGGASTNFIWPPAREDYATYWQESQTSAAGPSVFVPGSRLPTITNGPPWYFRTLKVSISNNITPYVFPQ